ncbi:hypothetical protein AVEN_119530-1 [Araneus ventricosus]|uniref:Uncharacterized protein n=1 Tax=Araneus ventricosus TaxID=182803 RepID=A0A4Y2JC26_ARAVE|nr:hypothetical protein AVEN_119530-1 [Araneus ventricosus]
MIPENATLFSIFLLGKGIHEKTPCDVTACRREYLKTAPRSEERLDRLVARLEARTSLEFYPLCELISCGSTNLQNDSNSTTADRLLSKKYQMNLSECKRQNNGVSLRIPRVVVFPQTYIENTYARHSRNVWECERMLPVGWAGRRAVRTVRPH